MSVVIHCKQYRFQPKLIASVLWLLVFSLLISLGFWQIRRANEKRQIIAAYQSKSISDVLTLQQLLKSDNKQYQLLKVRGQFINDTQLLLDNKIHNHQVGYEVITPVRVQGSDKYILVNRGWIPIGQSRQLLPTVQPVNEAVTLTGVVYIPSKQVLVLSDQLDPHSDKVYRIEKINFPQIEKFLNHKVFPFVVLLNADQNHGFVRQWKFINMPPEKHLAYATQWFTMATALIFLFIASQTTRRKNYEP